MDEIKDPAEGKNGGRETVIGLIFAFGLSVVMALCGYFGLLAGVEGKLQDFIWLRNGPEASTKRLVVLKIDDRAYRDFFKEQSPLSPAVLTDLVEKIASTRPTVLGVDVLTAATSEASSKKYQSFAKNFPNSNVVWASGGQQFHPEMANFFAWLSGKSDELVVRPTPVLAFEPHELSCKRDLLWGPAIFPQQQDLRLRRFPRQMLLATDPASDEANEIRHTWARVVAEQYCAHTIHGCSSTKSEELYISFAAAPPASFSIKEFFSPAPDSVTFKPFAAERLGHILNDQIALLGGTFASSRDVHQTPEGEIAGVFMNARAIAAEMAGVGFQEIPQPWSFLLDLVFGFSIVLLLAGAKKAFHIEAKNSRSMILVSATTAAIVILILYQTHYIFSPAAVAIGTIIQQLWDFLRNPLSSGQHAQPRTVPPHRPRSHPE